MDKKLEGKLSPEDVESIITFNDKIEKFNKLKIEIAASIKCKECPNKECKGRKFIWPEGNLNSKLMFISSSPTDTEASNHTIFSDAGGIFFTVMLNKLKYEKNSFYITSICKCNAEDPYIMASCFNYIKDEINIVSPRIIVTLGETTANVFRTMIFEKQYVEEDFDTIKDKLYAVKIDNIDYNVLHILDPNEVVNKIGALYNTYKLSIWKELNYCIKCLNAINNP